jgi:hypothetical protein
MSAPQQLTSREYKFLMRGDLFHEPLTAVQTYWHKITDLARQLNWEIVPSGIPGKAAAVMFSTSTPPLAICTSITTSCACAANTMGRRAALTLKLA